MRRVAPLMLLLLVAGPAGASARLGPRVSGATFSSVPIGWSRFDRDFDVLQASGTEVESFATSWRYRLGSPRPIGSLPPNGILVWVRLFRMPPARGRPNLCRQTPHLPGYPLVRALPLRLPRVTSSTLEGSPRIPEYHLFGRIGESYDIELRVDIRNPRPPAQLLAEAQRVVDAIRFPSWPRRSRC
ncbi:MAG: hypothetical protein ACXVZW_04255 [Gaiellaceae bacterium]